MNSSSLLWTFQPPVGKTSWLFGTMHIRDNRVYRFCDSLYPLIQKADVYVGEMDLTPTDLPFKPPHYDLKAYFTLPQYFKIRKQLLRSFCIDIEKFAHHHPLVIMSAISASILVTDHAVHLDEHLWNYAKENQLTLEGLESAMEQFTLLHAIEPGPMYDQIKKISARPETVRKFSKRALDYYVNGEIHRLYHLTKSSMHHLRKPVIYRRNAVMAQRIIDTDPAMSYFVSVGAGHLCGQKGIIHILRKNGFTVNPVKNFPSLEE